MNKQCTQLLSSSGLVERLGRVCCIRTRLCLHIKPCAQLHGLCSDVQAVEALEIDIPKDDLIVKLLNASTSASLVINPTPPVSSLAANSKSSNIPVNRVIKGLNQGQKLSQMIPVASRQPENGASIGTAVCGTNQPLQPVSLQRVTRFAHGGLAHPTAHGSSMDDGTAVATPEQTAASSTGTKQRKRRKAPSMAEHRAWLQRIMAAAEVEEAAAKAASAAAGSTLGASVQSDVLVQLAADLTGAEAASSRKATKRRSKQESQLAAAAAEQAPTDVHGSVGQGVVGAVKAYAGDDSSPQDAAAAAHGFHNRGRGKGSRSSKQALRQSINESAAAVADVPRDLAAADDEQEAGQVAVADASSKGRERGRRASRGRQKQPSLSADHDSTEVAPAVDAAVAMTAAIDVSAVLGTDSITPSARRGKRKAKSAAADAEVEAAAGGDGDALQAHAPEAAKPKRSRSKGATASAVEGGAAAVPVKPVRRTKKVIAEEVREAARLGQFGELTLLRRAYSHISLFTGISNSQAWDELQASVVEPAVAAAAAGAEDIEGNARAGVGVEQVLQQLAGAVQHQQQHQRQQAAVAGGSQVSGTPRGSRGLCKTSGLGSFKQQVWLHDHIAGLQQQQQQQRDSEKLQTTGKVPAAAAAGALCEVDHQSTVAGKQSDSGNSSTVIPNLGYACLCMTMRNYDVFNSRDCVKKTRDAPDGLQRVSQLALANARDLLPLILWNEAHGIRLFRLSSCILPWMTSYQMEELPDWRDIQLALRAAGDAAKQLGHRLTFHPSEYCKIAGERLDWVKQSVQELEVHSRIFDEMGFLPATPHNKINIHVGGTYGGNKDATLRRFSRVVNEQLSPNCKARLTVENDDKASMYSVADLQLVHQLTGIPLVFDFHHWKFCTGGQTQEEAFKSAIATWPAGVRPVVHWSESPEESTKRRSAHSEYVDGPMNLYGLEGQVDVMIESKAKELALLEYRQSVLEGWTVKPRHRNWKGTGDPASDITPADVVAAEAAAAEAAAVEAVAAAEDDDGDGDDAEDGEEVED